jgi:hypothetical protein
LGRNCIPRHDIEVKIEGTRRRVRRRKKILDDLEKRGDIGIKKKEAQDLTLWRTRFGRGRELAARRNDD